MITVYVIESLSDKTWYTGMAKDAVRRLHDHNGGKNRFTKGHLPWKIIYTEQHPKSFPDTFFPSSLLKAVFLFSAFLDIYQEYMHLLLSA